MGGGGGGGGGYIENYIGATIGVVNGEFRQWLLE